MRITWLGHAAFLLEDGTNSVLIDPFVSENPSFPVGEEDKLVSATHILLTHGHGDHLGDTVKIAKATGATIVTIFETAQYLAKKCGVDSNQIIDMNIGGSLHMSGGLTVHMVQAMHSNGIVDGDNIIYGGFPTGFVIEMGGACIYHAGDTGVFGDMKIIQDIYQPTVGLLPIGDHYTMSPKAAAYACNELLNLKTIIPMHRDTFPVLTGKAEEFERLVRRGAVVALKPGEGIDI